MESVRKEKLSISTLLKFIVPSLIGVGVLMFPFKYKGESTIFVALLSKTFKNAIDNIVPIPILITILIVISTVLTLVYKISKPNFIEKNEFLKKLFNVSIFWTLSRILGLIFCILVLFKMGPEIIWSEDTGGLILYSLIGGLFTVFLIAGFLIPLLTEFGLLEFIGVYLTGVMRPLFGLPGRSSIDCIASWVGDGTIGVALTNKQYLEGYYSEKEAAVIGTTFSAVSITFCLVILEEVGMIHMFGQYYFTVTVAGIVAAFIVPRIPPLSRKKDTYFTGTKKDMGEVIPNGFSKTEWAVQLATNKAKKNCQNPSQFISEGIKTVLDLWLGVLPIIMSFGTLALILAESTSIFQWLGTPFYPLLKLFGIPEALEASHTMVIGFADMFLPAVFATKFNSEMTKFVVACVSVTQLIYMSETGAVMLGSDIPVDFKDLFIIFIERTLITLPVICLFAHLFF